MAAKMLSMVLGNYGKIDKVMVGEIFHVMGMTFGTVMALPHPCDLNLVVVVEGSLATDDEDYLAIALMGMKSA